MAKINKRVKGGRTHQIGPTLFTTKVFKYVDNGHDEEIRYEAWRLRSDGALQTRLIRVTEVLEDGTLGKATKPRGTAFRNVGTIQHGPNIDIEWVRSYLRSRHYHIVKEMI